MPLYPFINGPRPPFPVPPIVGRVNTPPSGGAIPQRDFAIDDVESDWILAGPYHTEALQEAIAVARRICFSEFGIRMTAMALTVPWEDFPVGGASSPLLAVDAEVDPNAIAAVNDYQRAQCMTVVVDSMTRDDGAVLGNAPTELSINFQVRCQSHGANQAHHSSSKPLRRPDTSQWVRRPLRSTKYSTIVRSTTWQL
jgi:hypothetical protein